MQRLSEVKMQPRTSSRINVRYGGASQTDDVLHKQGDRFDFLEEKFDIFHFVRVRARY